MKNECGSTQCPSRATNAFEKFCWLLLILLLCFAVTRQLVGGLAFIEPPHIYERCDFLQQYLMGRAWLQGDSLYTPLPELFRRYISPTIPYHYQHFASPYPPSAAILFVPFAFLSYTVAVKLWFALRLVLLCGAVVVAVRALVTSSPRSLMVVGALVLLSSAAFRSDHYWGQLSTLILFLATCMWISLRKSNDGWAGFFLGMMLATKLIGVGLFVFLWFKGKIRSVLVAGGTFLALNIMSLSGGSFADLQTYFFNAAPKVARSYLPFEHNQSFLSVFYRIVSGRLKEAVPPWSGLEDPLITGNEVFVAGLLLVVVAAALLVVAIRMHSFDLGLGMALMVSVLILPPVFNYSALIFALPLTVLANHLWTFRQGTRYKILPLLLVACWSLGPALRFLDPPFASIPHLQEYVRALFYLGSFFIALLIIFALWWFDRQVNSVKQ